MKKILIVEDDRLLNKTLAYNLALEGYEITAAGNVREARGLIGSGEYDLALLDINLPDGNGYQLCELIKQEQPHTMVIFLTANDQEKDQIKGYEAGAVDYITKPFLSWRCRGKLRPCSPCWNITGRRRIFMMTESFFWILRGKVPH